MKVKDWLSYEKSKRRQKERRRREAIHVDIIQMPKNPEIEPCDNWQIRKAVSDHERD